MSNPAVEQAPWDQVRRLAEFLYPLPTWLKQDKRYQPPDEEAARLPWRNGEGTLNFEALHTMARLQALMTSPPAEEQALMLRWNKIAAVPRWIEPSLPYPPSRRADLGLDAAAVFAPADSDNVTTTMIDPKSGMRAPCTRAEFYGYCWPLLTATFPSQPGDDGAMKLFVTELWNDTRAKWPKTSSVKSSEFLKRLGKDIAICLLDMENPLLPDNDTGRLWQRAVLIEAGEHRYRGNAYDEQTMKGCVYALNVLLNEKLGVKP